LHYTTISYIKAHPMEKNCTNCDTPLAGKFCSACGQKITHRITLHHIWHEFVHAFTHADKGFFFLFVQLSKRPGTVAREYILEGKRKKYFSPFQYILIIGAVATFIMTSTHIMDNIMKESGISSLYREEDKALLYRMNYYQTKYFNIILLLQLPFYALSVFWIYKKYRYNFAECLTLQCFLSAQTTIFSLTFILLIPVIGMSAMVISLIVSIIYQVFAYLQFFGEKSAKGILRSIAAVLLGIILPLLLLSAVALGLGLIYAKFIR